MRKIVATICLWLLIVPVEARAERKPLPLREMVVGVAVTPEFQQNKEWKEKFKKRIKYASQIFEREFKIKFKNATFWTWNPKTDSSQASDLMDDLMAQFSLKKKKVDFIIGLGRLTNVADITNVNDLDVLGIARPMSGYVFLRYPNNPQFKIQEETVLIHELGHLFGATHTEQKDTIMFPYVGRHIPTSFDTVNKRIIRTTRNLDFKYGAKALKSGALQNLVQAYQGVNIRNQHPQFFYALAGLYLKLDQDEKALDAFKQLRELRPEDGRVRYDMGMLYAKAGEYDDALRELNEAASLLAREKHAPTLLKTYVALGRVYFRLQNWQGAQRSWRKALELDPKNIQIKIDLAIVEIKLGQVASAEPVLTQAKNKDPDNIKVTGYLGVAAFMQKKYTDALSYFKEALRILDEKTKGTPTTHEEKFLYSEIYTGMGSTYWSLNRQQEATRYFTKACDVDGSLSCNEKLGRIYFQLGEYDAAIAKLAPVLQQDKSNGDLYGLLGVALTRKGDTQNAMGLFQEGLKHVEDAAKASQLHSNSGHLLLQTEQFDLAIQEFMSAVTKDWNNEDAHMGLALGYLHKGQPLDTKQVVRNLLGVNPRHPQAKQIMAEADKMIEQYNQQQSNQQVSVQFSGVSQAR